jgi:tetratricopeptide (TPR) repeat protein
MKQLIMLTALMLIISCQEKAIDTSSKLGEINIEVSGNEKAVPLFEEGLMFLHSFEFDDAAEKFREAQAADPSFGMAYWGEAMTENHPLWREQEYETAKEILAKLGESEEERSAKFKTEIEKDLYAAIQVLYGEGTKKERDLAYSAFMKDLHEKYTDNQEISAFYALSLLGSVKGKRDYETYGMAAKIAQSVIEENPNHPGALHYLIHSYDDPEHAHLALDAANSYAQVAPEANHALHMPSHIYVAMGMWDEVIKSNKAAFDASVKRIERKKLEGKDFDYHSLKWLMYGHLQQGKFDKAKQLVLNMQGYCYKNPTPRAVSHNVMMKAAYFTETEEWDDPLLSDTIDYSDLPIQIKGAHTYLKARYALHVNDIKQFDSLLASLDEAIADTKKKVMAGESPMCSGSYSRRRPTQTQLDRTLVIKKELEALRALQENNVEKAEQLMAEATKLEEQTTYMYGPPDIVKPSHEMYAEWLESTGRLKESKEMFEKVLERAPKRLIPTSGIERIANKISS